MRLPYNIGKGRETFNKKSMLKYLLELQFVNNKKISRFLDKLAKLSFIIPEKTKMDSQQKSNTWSKRMHTGLLMVLLLSFPFSFITSDISDQMIRIPYPTYIVNSDVELLFLRRGSRPIEGYEDYKLNILPVMYSVNGNAACHFKYNNNNNSIETSFGSGENLDIPVITYRNSLRLGQNTRIAWPSEANERASIGIGELLIELGERGVYKQESINSIDLDDLRLTVIDISSTSTNEFVNLLQRPGRCLLDRVYVIYHQEDSDDIFETIPRESILYTVSNESGNLSRSAERVSSNSRESSSASDGANQGSQRRQGATDPEVIEIPFRILDWGANVENSILLREMRGNFLSNGLRLHLENITEHATGLFLVFKREDISVNHNITFEGSSKFEPIEFNVVMSNTPEPIDFILREDAVTKYSYFLNFIFSEEGSERRVEGIDLRNIQSIPQHSLIRFSEAHLHFTNENLYETDLIAENQVNRYTLEISSLFETQAPLLFTIAYPNNDNPQLFSINPTTIRHNESSSPFFGRRNSTPTTVELSVKMKAIEVDIDFSEIHEQESSISNVEYNIALLSVFQNGQLRVQSDRFNGTMRLSYNRDNGNCLIILPDIVANAYVQLLMANNQGRFENICRARRITDATRQLELRIEQLPMAFYRNFFVSIEAPEGENLGLEDFPISILYRPSVTEINPTVFRTVTPSDSGFTVLSCLDDLRLYEYSCNSTPDFEFQRVNVENIANSDDKRLVLILDYVYDDVSITPVHFDNIFNTIPLPTSFCILRGNGTNTQTVQCQVTGSQASGNLNISYDRIIHKYFSEYSYGLLESENDCWEMVSPPPLASTVRVPVRRKGNDNSQVHLEFSVNNPSHSRPIAVDLNFDRLFKGSPYIRRNTQNSTVSLVRGAATVSTDLSFWSPVGDCGENNRFNSIVTINKPKGYNITFTRNNHVEDRNNDLRVTVSEDGEQYRFVLDPLPIHHAVLFDNSSDPVLLPLELQNMLDSFVQNNTDGVFILFTDGNSYVSADDIEGYNEMRRAFQRFPQSTNYFEMMTTLESRYLSSRYITSMDSSRYFHRYHIIPSASTIRFLGTNSNMERFLDSFDLPKDEIYFYIPASNTARGVDAVVSRLENAGFHVIRDEHIELRGN